MREGAEAGSKQRGRKAGRRCRSSGWNTRARGCCTAICATSIQEQMIAIMRETDVLILSSATRLLFLGNVENAAVSREVMQEARRLINSRRREKFRKMAAVGVTGMKGVFLDALVGMFGKSGVEIRVLQGRT